MGRWAQLPVPHEGTLLLLTVRRKLDVMVSITSETGSVQCELRTHQPSVAQQARLFFHTGPHIAL